MATFQYNQQYPGDAASISPASSFGYESANSWSQQQSSPVSTANYGDLSHSRSFDSSTGDNKSAKQIRAEAIQRHRNKKSDLKAKAMSEEGHVSVHETKDQIKQDNAKEARNLARAAHREKKAQMKAMAMMTVQHGGAPSSSLTAKQGAGLRYDAQQSQEAETKRLVNEMKKDSNDYVTKKLVAARGMESQATTSRKKIGKWFGNTRDPDMQELKCQLEREREKDAERKALKYLKVYETEEGFQIM
jgi:hypothetical protein